FLSQMAMECGGLHRFGGGSAHLFHPVYSPHYVVEQKTTAGWAGGGILPPTDPEAADRFDSGGSVWRRRHPGVVVFLPGANISGRGGTDGRPDAHLLLSVSVLGGRSAFNRDYPGLPEPAGCAAAGKKRSGPVHSQTASLSGR